MKQFILAVVVLFALNSSASAQTKKDSKTKSEKTTTVPQKVHNVIHPKHKRYSGHKSKHKTSTK
ncbi:MAG: hypothetical protein ACJ748_13985 [Flavisolibacter sp.]